MPPAELLQNADHRRFILRSSSVNGKVQLEQPPPLRAQSQDALLHLQGIYEAAERSERLTVTALKYMYGLTTVIAAVKLMECIKGKKLVKLFLL